MRNRIAGRALFFVVTAAADVETPSSDQRGSFQRVSVVMPSPMRRRPIWSSRSG
jgi:hypothetical protein